MKIAASSVLPLPHPIVTSPRALPPPPATPAIPFREHETAQERIESETRFAQADVVSYRYENGLLRGLQSQATQSYDRTQRLIADYHKGLDSNARSLRRQFNGQHLANPKASLKFILAFCGGNAAMTQSLLQAAVRQAKDDGHDGEGLFYRRQLQLLRKELGSLPRFSPGSLSRHKRRLREASTRLRTDPLYRVTMSGPSDIVGFVDALLAELREKGGFEAALKELRSDIASDVAAAATSGTVYKARSLITGLTTTRHVAALLRECEHLLGRMRGKNPGLRVEAIALLRHLLTLIGTLMDPEQTRTLVELIGGKRLGNQLACINELRRLLSQRLPVQLWRTKNDFYNVRENLLILSTVLTDEEQRLPQENRPPCNT